MRGGVPLPLWLAPELCSHRVREPLELDLAQRCLTCGTYGNPRALWLRLRGDIWDRYRLPPSPWTSAELAEEADL